jgi:hypothetical protein
MFGVGGLQTIVGEKEEEKSKGGKEETKITRGIREVFAYVPQEHGMRLQGKWVSSRGI